MKGTAIVASKKEGLSLHVNVGGIVGESSNLIGEEYCGGVQVLADAVTHHSAQLLYLLFFHLLLLLLLS